MRAALGLLSWIGVTAAATGALATLWTQKREVFLPGATTRGHHQIQEKCDLCHAAGGVREEACAGCHAEALDAAGDLHPRVKFLDPRSADLVARLDARRCATCHAEHRDALGVTQPRDFCGVCHADVVRDANLPSHKDLSFASCQDAGCHRFHDNRGVRPSFLRKHTGEPETFREPRLAQITHVRRPAQTAEDPPADADPKVVALWHDSAHARAGVGCASCHGDPWVARPERAACARCHTAEVAGFEHGLHGMRLAAGLSPMTPGAARLPMVRASADHELGCASCHDAHSVDTRAAATDACLGCHADRHSTAFRGTTHEQNGVTCATCHLPRVTVAATGAVGVEHDQDRTLRPREAMLRTVCVACHGVPFALAALVDDALVNDNFARRPEKPAPALEMLR